MVKCAKRFFRPEPSPPGPFRAIEAALSMHLTLALTLFFCVHSFIFLDHISNHFLSTMFPLLSVLNGIVEVLVTTDAEDRTFFQFLRQRNNICYKRVSATWNGTKQGSCHNNKNTPRSQKLTEIKEPNLALVPKLAWVGG